MKARSEKTLRCSDFMTWHCKVICPTGNFGEFLSTPSAKDIFLPFFRIMCFPPRVPPRQEGRFAIVTNVRWDAVAATERATSAAEADGEAVWFWRPLAGVKFAKTPKASRG